MVDDCEENNKLIWMENFLTDLAGSRCVAQEHTPSFCVWIFVGG